MGVPALVDLKDMHMITRKRNALVRKMKKKNPEISGSSILMACNFKTSILYFSKIIKLSKEFPTLIVSYFYCYLKKFENCCIFSQKYFQKILDIDECASGISGCSQHCTNLPGAFICSCDEQFYQLTENNETCVRKDDGEFFLLKHVLLFFLLKNFYQK